MTFVLQFLLKLILYPFSASFKLGLYMIYLKRRSKVEHILKVTVCGCAGDYHGVFEGRRFTITRTRWRKLRKPIRFKIQEVPVGRGQKEDDAIAQHRSHFFFDSHSVGGTWWSAVSKNYRHRGNIVQPRSFCVKIGRDEIWSKEVWNAKKNEGPEPAIARMKSILESLTRDQLHSW